MGAQPEPPPMPPDRAWHETLSRLDTEEAERRLAEVERALNEGGR